MRKPAQTWWYPLNIFTVEGGNHSIAQGIILCEGKVQPSEAFDLTQLLRHIRFDGRVWRDIKSEESLGKPRYKELGYIFEIGRHIVALNRIDDKAQKHSVGSEASAQ